MLKKLLTLSILAFHLCFFSQKKEIQHLLNQNTSNYSKAIEIIKITDENLESEKINVDSIFGLIELSIPKNQLYITSLLKSKLFLFNNDLKKAEKAISQIDSSVIKSKRLLCELYFIKGKISLLNNENSSLYWINKSYNITLTLNDYEAKYRALRNLGEYFIKTSQYIKAVDFYEKANQIAVNLCDTSKVIDYQITLGKIAKYTEDYDRLIEINKSLLLNYSSSIISKRIIYIYNNLAVGYAEKKEYLKSIDYQLKTLALSDTGSISYYAIANNLGTTLLDYYSQNPNSFDSISMLIERNNLEELVLIQNVEDLQLKIENIAMSAMSFYSKIENSPFELYPYLTLGKLKLEQCQYAKAEDLLLTAYALSEKTKNLSTLIETSFLLSKLYEEHLE